MIKYKFLYLATTIFILASQNLYAQTVRITDLVDFNGGTWAGESGQINLEDNICIYSSTGSYTITASGSGAANRFRVENGGEFLNYTVRWNDEPSTTTGQIQLTKTVTSATQTTTETVSDDCSAGASPTAYIQVRFGNGQLRGNIPGTYTGTLTLLVSPI
jgi:hypothetical protein